MRIYINSVDSLKFLKDDGSEDHVDINYIAWLMSMSNEEEDREIIWTHIDHEEMLKDALAGLEEELDEDMELIRIDHIKNDMEQWVADTNFDISDFDEIIMSCPGVDGFQQLSRYKFTILVGKMFTMTKIRPLLIEKLGLKRDSKKDKFV